MELDGERGHIGIIHALAGAVVAVDKTQGRVFRQRVAVHRIAVVLARHVGQPGLDVLRGLICAAVAVLQLGGLCALTERQQLMPQADAEGRDAVAHEFAQVRNHGGVIRRVAGAVGQHHAVVLADYVLRLGVRRNNRDLTAALAQLALDVVLYAVVEQRP